MIRRAPGASDAHAYDISNRTPTPINAKLTIGSRSAAAQKRARRKFDLQNSETDLIQDFAFPTVSHRIKLSRDARYVFASGTYPPQIHVYDTDELSLKFKRHVTNDIVDFQTLEDDWRKFALLTADRYVDVHSQFGSHFKTRVPRHGRDLMLHPGTCDLYVCGEGADVWRLNLHQGRFMTPFPTVSGANGGNNVCGINPLNRLLAFGGETALLDIWDPRVAAQTKKPAATLDVRKALLQEDTSSIYPALEISSLRFDESDGVTLAVGTSLGLSLLFDLRSPNPIRVRDQGNGLPIRSIRLHDNGSHCISADPKSIKVWDRTTGVNMVAIEPNADVNHLCLMGSSGVMCAAVETQRVKTYYVPALGPAPKWCSFLDNFTEELEVKDQVERGNGGLGAGRLEHVEEDVYENYKFVSHDELEGLGLAHLIGTDLLKAYMHGYFIHQKLYRRAVDVSEPFAYEKYRKEKARERLELERQSRITKVKRNSKRKVSVNQKVLETLQQRQRGSKNRNAAATAVVDDERFSAMFTNKDYAVDEEAERFQYLYPSGTGQKPKLSEDNSDEEYLEQFELVDEGQNDCPKKSSDVDSGILSSSDEDEEDHETEESNELRIIARPREMDRKATQEGKARRVKSTATNMYKLGELGEAVRTCHRLSTHGPSRGLRQKLREEISLGERIVPTRLGGSRSGTKGPKKGRRHQTRPAQQANI